MKSRLDVYARRCLRGVILSALLLVTSCTQAPAGFETLSGGAVNFEQLHGRWVLVNYWALWCKPCLEEIPELNQAAKLHAEHMTVLGVNYDDLQGQALEEAVERFDIQFEVLLNDPAIELGAERPSVLPVTLVINPQGELESTLIGPQSLESLREATGLH